MADGGLPDGAGRDHGAPGKRKVVISVPEHYKPVSDEVWEDLESYIYQGFLTSPVHLAGMTFVFKTLNHNELSLIRMMRPLRASPPEVRASFQARFIAHSILMVNGENVLKGRTRHSGRLTRTIHKLDRGVQEKIIESLGALNSKAARLYPLTEVYVHENRSRFKWMHVRQAPVHSPVNTGIPGTDEVGMNYCQQAWTALNCLLDSKEQMEREWTNAKFIGSCFAGKGVRSIDERDKARRERERTDLEELKMKVLYAYLNRHTSAEEEQGVVQLPDGRTASVSKKFQAESVDELADQLSAALSGEKDHHDLVIEEKAREMRKRAEQIERSRHKIYQSAPLLPPGVGTTSAGVRILGGKAEADELLERARRLQSEQIQRLSRQIPGDAESSDEGSGGGHG